MHASQATRSRLAPSSKISTLTLAVHLSLSLLVFSQSAQAQNATVSSDQKAADKDEKVLGTVRVTADAVPKEIEAKETYQAVTSTIGKGKQALRDIPQSVTVVTEHLIDDRHLDTLKDALHQTAGVTFLAAEGGEEDVRLRGYSMQQTGDILIDGMRDPAIYERDTFNYDRVEVLRGSASMLFGRGSTGGVVNQVSKQAFMLDQNEVEATYGTGNYARVTTDLNFVTGDASAFRLNAMKNMADNNGAGSSIDKEGVSGNYRWGIGEKNEFSASVFYLKNRNGINYGLPWLQTTAGSTDRTLINKDPSTYYGLDSDYANSDALNGTLSHIFRIAGGGEIKTSFRASQVSRDQRASTIRFAGASAQPDGQAVTADNISDDTVLTRGTQNKIQRLQSQVLQSDYTDKFKWLGLTHAVTAGVDFNHEFRTTYSAVIPSGVTITKTNTTVGDTDGAASVNEGARSIRTASDFDVYSAGTYFQDLVQVAEHWKVLGGMRFDYVNGTYNTYSTADSTLGQITADRARQDRLLSHRAGVIYQPNDEYSFHVSYGTSFNTSGDTYQYDAKGTNTPPEKSRNIEIGSKMDLFGGDLSARVALFHTTKYNERNTDSESVNDDNYVLSAERYAKGIDADISGRITPNWEVYFSYSWIPVAKISKGTSTGGEAVGTRPGLIPKHQATLWNTYKFNQDWRAGFGLNGRSKMYPQLVNTFQTDGYITVDTMVEYTVTRGLTLKLNGTNLTNRLYADSVYRGHYVPGKGRTFLLSASYKF